MAEITAAMVKALRDRTGAGMMDCRNALVEAGGDEERAVEIIQKKGLAKAVKKAGAIATEGVIHAYIHSGSRVGVLVEVNCQTDFVARNEAFRAFVDLVGLQIASMSPEYVRREDVPAEVLAARRAMFREQVALEDEKSGKKRPEAAVDKIVEGKLGKWLTEVCLVEQPSITDESKTIGQLADELTARLGEKIAVRRFVRYQLGEGLERKAQDLAADVAATLAGAG
ncbi:MAG: translation elongation factor Ts [Myxococcota bacterium]|nr:translation elongation factor Ts [Myxococcota bacterium]MDW8361738.1 translation elongation factor Ts [Myxococcales bacterium]